MELDMQLDKQYKVLYLSKIQRLKFMVVVENGRFYKAIDGARFTTTTRKVFDDLGMGFDSYTQAYACDKHGNLFVIDAGMKDDNGKPIQINHSTLAAGDDVICAGSISIKNGRLKAISNSSGHYAPTTTELTNYLQYLNSVGVDLTPVVVRDQLLGITTFSFRYLAQNYVEMRRDPLIDRVLQSTT
jgi:hypothetical protein